MTSELAYAFVAGTVATANPCGFALLPAYLARQLGADSAQHRGADALIRATAVGGVTTAGFLLVFGTIGTAISVGARSLTQVIPWAALVIGVALVAAGLAVLTGRRVGLRLPIPSVSFSGRRTASVLLFGVAYGLASLSCTLPIFLTVVGASITGDVPAGLLMFVAYAAGMGTILTALAVAAALSRAGLALAIRRVLPYVHRLSGALLLAAGAYIVYYWAFFLTPGSATRTTGRGPIEIVTGASARMGSWLGQGTGQTVTALLLAGLGGLIVWSLVRGMRGPRGERAPSVLQSVPDSETEPRIPRPERSADENRLPPARTLERRGGQEAGPAL